MQKIRFFTIIRFCIISFQSQCMVIQPCGVLNRVNSEVNVQVICALQSWRYCHCSAIKTAQRCWGCISCGTSKHPLYLNGRRQSGATHQNGQHTLAARTFGRFMASQGRHADDEIRIWTYSRYMIMGGWGTSLFPIVPTWREFADLLWGPVLRIIRAGAEAAGTRAPKTAGMDLSQERSDLVMTTGQRKIYR
jgi:hypothetical protein